MLKAINTKILLAILAALTVIGSAAIYQQHEAAKAARPQPKLLRSFSNSKRTPRNEEKKMRRSARRLKQDKKRHNSAASKRRQDLEDVHPLDLT